MSRRLFLSLPVPAKLSILLASALHFFENKEANILWVPVQNLHITFSFFGNIVDEKISTLAKEISLVAKSTDSIELFYDCITFGLPEREPRIIWAELKSTEEYRNFANEIAGIAHWLLGFDFPKKENIPHITLARIKKPEMISVKDTSQVMGIEEAVGIKKKQ
jgi:RNA 2',3'-cyclic 3'-phosphodiesterase